MAEKANAKITAQTKINGELMSKEKKVYIPVDMAGCVAEYGEASCVDMIVNQKVLNIQGEIRREIKVEHGEAKECGSVRRGLIRL